MERDSATAAERRMLAGLLDAFRKLGPIESLDWFATYFDQDFTNSMRAHGHPIDWVDDLRRDILALITKYKAKQADGDHV